jgi:ribosomal protein L11 methyltransferase
MDYIELKVDLKPRNPWSEILTAELSELGFDSFVDTETGIQAYAPVEGLDLDFVIKNSLLSGENQDVEIAFEKIIIPHQNWNAQWESDFHPVEVENYLTIVAPFHSKEDKKGMIVEIQPQMSFGTGHHQTTWLMSKFLFEIGQLPDSVLDMGTGTGVLAIIAEKLGAKEIVAIDIEDWSAVNAKENTERNHCSKIETFCGDIELIAGKSFGLIIANINKNVLKAQIPSYSKTLKKGGTLLLSGFFESDVDEMILYASEYNLKMVKILTKETWAAIEMIKN